MAKHNIDVLNTYAIFDEIRQRQFSETRKSGREFDPKEMKDVAAYEMASTVVKVIDDFMSSDNANEKVITIITNPIFKYHLNALKYTLNEKFKYGHSVEAEGCLVEVSGNSDYEIRTIIDNGKVPVYIVKQAIDETKDYIPDLFSKYVCETNHNVDEIRIVLNDSYYPFEDYYLYQGLYDLADDKHGFLRFICNPLRS